MLLLTGFPGCIHEPLLVLHEGAGMRDARRLQSALAHPRHYFAYEEKPNRAQMAAIYTGGTVQNHPFVDNNKRTGFAIGILFPELNGRRFDATEEEATQAVFALAAGEFKKEGYAAFLRSNATRRRR